MRIPHLIQHAEATQFCPILHDALTAWPAGARQAFEYDLGQTGGYSGDIVVDISEAADFGAEHSAYFLLGRMFWTICAILSSLIRQNGQALLHGTSWFWHHAANEILGDHR